MLPAGSARAGTSGEPATSHAPWRFAMRRRSSAASRPSGTDWRCWPGSGRRRCCPGAGRAVRGGNGSPEWTWPPAAATPLALTGWRDSHLRAWRSPLSRRCHHSVRLRDLKGLCSFALFSRSMPSVHVTGLRRSTRRRAAHTAVSLRRAWSPRYDRLPGSRLHAACAVPFSAAGRGQLVMAVTRLNAARTIMTAAAVRVIQWNGTTRSSWRPPVMASAPTAHRPSTAPIPTLRGEW